MSAVTAITGRDPARPSGEAELHETPREAVFALVKADPFLQRRRVIWEPACGPGALVWALQTCGHTVLASDLYQYEGRWRADPLTVRDWRMDFLGLTSMPFYGWHRLQPDAIVMNPPYSKADAFVDQAMTLAPRVYALLELGWLQAETWTRDRLLDGDLWRRFHPFRERLDMHRDSYAGPKATTRKHAWFVFGRDPMGEEIRFTMPITRRLSVGGDQDG